MPYLRFWVLFQDFMLIEKYGDLTKGIFFKKIEVNFFYVLQEGLFLMREILTVEKEAPCSYAIFVAISKIVELILKHMTTFTFIKLAETNAQSCQMV